MKALYVPRFASWAPGLSSRAEWQEWAEGTRDIAESEESPGLEFVVGLFRRRLSQISRMTIQVIHDALPIGQDTKIVFVSFRGEIAQQLKINKMLVQDGFIMPAAFSHSVFNAPPALAAIALHLTAGYTAVYPPNPAAGAGHFDTGLLAAAAPVLCGDAEETLLVYADELCPPEYAALFRQKNRPLAFSALISNRDGASEGGAAAIPLPQTGGAAEPESPAGFLRRLYRNSR